MAEVVVEDAAVAQRMTTLMLRCRLPWVRTGSDCDQFTSPVISTLGVL